jgi:diaminopimelate epimerase
MVASGNDFVVAAMIKQKTKIKNLANFARLICDRKCGVGADGLLILEQSKISDIKMRIFNPDGSEAEMCGNGSRCVSLWLKSKIPHLSAGRKNQKSRIFKIETKAGIIESGVNGNNIKIKLTGPKDIKLDIPVKINNRTLRVNFINTGVPHTVIFAEGLDKIDVFSLGRRIRYHRKFAPAGTNVDFVEVLDNDSIKIRTYERGVEDETLACGTGAVASALTFSLKTNATEKINVETKSTEVLTVYFSRGGNKFNNVWLQGKAQSVFVGKFNY